MANAKYGNCVDYSGIAGNDAAKRALQIAAAGGHGILLIGPSGSEKEALARLLPTILTELDEREARETALVYEQAGKDFPEGASRTRPFREIGSPTSLAKLVGGGYPVMPGEASLAHNGVLMLAGLPEFTATQLMALRSAMAEGEITIVRVRGIATFPSRFMLAATAEPCPCGRSGAPELGKCACPEAKIRRYLDDITGSLSDAIDLFAYVSRMSPGIRAAEGPCMTSESMRDGVLAAREFRRWRAERCSDPFVNINSLRTLESCPERLVDMILRAQFPRLDRMDTRPLMRVLSVARTLADMSQKEQIGEDDVLGAMLYARM